MLGYLEQTPLYNAANFSWAVGASTAWQYQFHRLNHRSQSIYLPVRRFVAHPPDQPEDVTAGLNNNYLASVGTSTNYSSEPYRRDPHRHHRRIHRRGADPTASRTSPTGLPIRSRSGNH